MLELCHTLCIEPGSEMFDFIATEWLSKCLHDGMGDDSKVGPINNNNEICPHGRVDPSRVTNMKAISVAAVSVFLYHNCSILNALYCVISWLVVNKESFLVINNYLPPIYYFRQISCMSVSLEVQEYNVLKPYAKNVW